MQFLTKRSVQKQGMRKGNKQHSMSIEKVLSFPKQQQKRVLKKQREDALEMFGLHQLRGATWGLDSSNTVPDKYSVCINGTLGGHLWSLNLSQHPGQVRRLLTIVSGNTFFVNLTTADFPAQIDILVNEIAGFLDEDGNATHVVASLIPVTPAVPLMNEGGIAGFNLAYTLMGKGEDSFDISGLPTLTFDINVKGSEFPFAYPLVHPISLKANVIHAIF